MTPIVLGSVGVGFMFLLMAIGMPIALGMALAGFAGLVYLHGLGPALWHTSTIPFSCFNSYTLCTIPLFILMGNLTHSSGITRGLYAAVYAWLGRLRGGLAMATVGACALFAAISGSSTATAATIGTVALPEMRKYKYDDALATGCVAAGGTMGILIPPSIVLIVYGVLVEQPIGKLFLAGFIPGILEAVFYMVTIYILCKLNPRLGPPGPRITFREKTVALYGVWPAVALFLLVMGGIYMGFFTPTEAAGIGAFGAFILAISKKALTRHSFAHNLRETGKMVAFIVLIIAGAELFSVFLAATRLPDNLATFVNSLQVNRYVILTFIVLMYIGLGTIITAVAMLVLTLPIVFPVIVSLGFDPIWFGIIIVRMCEIGQITPPVGLNVFTIRGVAPDVPLYTIFRGVVPFIVADVWHVTLLIAFPPGTLFLPNLMK